MLAREDPATQAAIQKDLTDVQACSSLWHNETSPIRVNGESGDEKTSAVEKQLTSMKKVADLRVKNGDSKGALVAYQKIREEIDKLALASKVFPLSSESGRFYSDMTLAALSNSSLCHAMQGKYKEAVQDCSLAISQLAKSFNLTVDSTSTKDDDDTDLTVAEQIRNHLASRLDDEYHLSKQASLARLLRRRATALGHLKHYDPAIQSLRCCRDILEGAKQTPEILEEIDSDIKVFMNLKCE